VRCPRLPTGEPGTVPGSFDARVLLGMSERAADALAARHGCVVRVAMRDGEGSTLTGDARLDRIDIVVIAGKVAGVEAG